MFKRIAATVVIAAGGVALGINLADEPDGFDASDLPALADIDFADTERWWTEVGHDTDSTNERIANMWRNGDELCDIAASGLNWRDVVRALYANGWVESAEEVAWARGYVSGCDNRAYLDRMG